MLFRKEEVWNVTKKEIARDAKQRYIQKGADSRDNLYDKLQKHLVLLGHINDLLAAFSDKTKPVALAHEFGLNA